MPVRRLRIGARKKAKDGGGNASADGGIQLIDGASQMPSQEDGTVSLLVISNVSQ